MILLQLNLLFIQNIAQKLWEKIGLTLLISSFDLRTTHLAPGVDNALCEIILYQILSDVKS
jgi:hypothetical protein